MPEDVLTLARRAKREGDRLITRGGVKIVVIAPCVLALAIPFVALFRSLNPITLGVLGAIAVIGHGTLDIIRGISKRRELARIEATLPQARLLP